MSDDTHSYEPAHRLGDEAQTSSREGRLDEVIALYLWSVQNGTATEQQEWLARYPDLAPELAEFFADRGRMERLAGPVRSALAGRAPGTKVGYIGDYEILEELGRGGMGVVYKVRQTSLKRLVALKMILAGVHASTQDLARFRAEAEAVARLQHPHIVQIHEIGVHQGHPYAALEFVEGGTLGQKLAGTPLPGRQAARLVETLAHAIHAAHKEGIVHRDLKPANILLAHSNSVQALELGSDPDATRYEPKITDFGLAKLVKEDSGQTKSGAIVGTPSYMAPEQAAGNTKQIGPTADIYSLGAILYELLTGRPPFRAETPMDTLMQVITQEPVSPRQLQPTVQRDLETICLKCLLKDPRKRYHSAEALADDLRRFLDGRPIQARPVGLPERSWRWCKRNPVVAALLMLVALSMASGTAVATLFAIEAGDRAAAEATQRARAEQERQAAEEARTAETKQREEAERRRGEADQARREEQEQRRLAVQREKEAHWSLYMARLLAMTTHWHRQELGQVERLLDQYTPAKGAADFRGWEWHYLRDQCEQNVRRISSAADLSYLVWSPDGKRLASRRPSDSAILVWDPDRARVEHTFPGKGNLPLAWSPDGQLLAAGFESGAMHVWDIKSGQKTQTLTGSKQRRHLGRRYGLAWSRNGKFIAYGGDSWCEIWSPEGKLLRELTIGGEENVTVHGLDWHPKDQRLAVAAYDGAVYVFEGETGKQLWRRSVCNIECTDVAWNSDGKRLACAASYPYWAVRVLDEKGTLLVSERPMGGGGKLSWSSDGVRLVSASGGPKIQILDTEQAKVLNTIHVHQKGVTFVAWRPDSEQVASVDGKGELKLWYATSKQEPATVIAAHAPKAARGVHPAVSVAWSPDATKLVSGGHDGRVIIWDARTGQNLRTLVSGSPIHFVAWRPQGKWVAAVGVQGRITIWDAETGEVLRNMYAGSHGILFRHLGWSSDGSRLVCSVSELPDPQRGNKPVLYWEDGGLGEQRQVTTSRRTTVAWAPGGQRLALPHPEGVGIWSIPDHKMALATAKVEAWVSDLDWSPDGRIVAASTGNGSMTFVHPVTGTKLTTIYPHTSYFATDWSPDGSRIATGGSDGVLKILDGATADELVTLVADGDAISSVAWSPDRRRLASADVAGTIRLWGSIDMPEMTQRIDHLRHGILASAK